MFFNVVSFFRYELIWVCKCIFRWVKGLFSSSICGLVVRVCVMDSCCCLLLERVNVCWFFSWFSFVIESSFMVKFVWILFGR